MPKKKYTFKPKEMEDYRDPSLEDYESRFEDERVEGLEGEYLRSPSDVRDDYWKDEDREKREKPEGPPRRSRPLKKPRPMIRKFPKRTQRNNKRSGGRYGR